MSSTKKVLGVVAHNYLRETGVRRMRQDVRIAFFGSPDSALHRIADYSCPLPSLDVSEADLWDAVMKAKDRGIQLDGLVSMRDPNVPAAAAIARNLWEDRSPSADGINRVTSKFRFRQWLKNESGISDDIVARVPCAELPHDIDQGSFSERVSSLLRHGTVIVKPDRGSCSFHINRLCTVEDLPLAWRQFKLASGYRKGDFIAEREISGDEMGVETIISDHVCHVGITPYLAPVPDAFFEVGHYVTASLSKELQERITMLAKAVHEALPLRYMITHMEIKVQRDGIPAIVELNPRLAGDLTQELHLLVSGIDYYRIAAHIATRREAVPDTLLRSAGRHPCALIKFHPPVAGRLRQVGDPAEYFKSSDDRFGLCHPSGALLTGGNTNDDRAAYILLAGNERAELEARATEALARSFTVDRAPFFLAPT